MDSLFVWIIIIALAALTNWIQQRAQGRQHPPPDPTGPPRPHLPPHPTHNQPIPPRRVPQLDNSLERQLRRLLGEEPDLPPQPRPAPVTAPVPLPRTSQRHLPIP